MRKFLIPVVLASVAGLAVLGLPACSSGGDNSTAGVGVTTGLAVTTAAQSLPTIQMDVLNGEKATTFGILAPDGEGHDSFVPAHFTAQAGQAYTMKIYNYDEGPHTFTIDALGIAETINAWVSESQPSVTTFTVTFTKTGTFRFYCKLPCDAGHGGWAMTADRSSNGADQDGFMAGYVTVI